MLFRSRALQPAQCCVSLFYYKALFLPIEMAEVESNLFFSGRVRLKRSKDKHNKFSQGSLENKAFLIGKTSMKLRCGEVQEIFRKRFMSLLMVLRREKVNNLIGSENENNQGGDVHGSHISNCFYHDAGLKSWKIRHDL